MKMGFFSAEIWRLVCSLQIAASAGDAPQLAPILAQIILDDLKGVRCLPLSDLSKWAQAIAWARLQPTLDDLISTSAPLGREREVIVGHACQRLRLRGYKITIGAYGPQIDEATRSRIIQSTEHLVSLLGGLETTSEVFGFLNATQLHHDGMWLFGEIVPNIFAAKQPMPPVGWILSLGLRHLNHRGRARNPAEAWKSLVELATDFAAIHDCQRYSQFAGINFHATQIHRAITESILWREFFSLPQMPAKALRQVLDVLGGILTHEDETKLGFAVAPLFKELFQLLELSSDNQMTLHSHAAVAQALPLLHRVTGGAKIANTDYGDPLSASERSQDSTLIFAYVKDQVVTLPRALLSAAACQLIFELIWKKLGERAQDIVKETLEKTIVNACQGKATSVCGNLKYYVRRSLYEIDAATRDHDQIVLLETKGKSLTSQSRSGDMFSFFNDYSESFLRMLSQLIRHEVHLRQGVTPLTVVGEKVDCLRPLKIAVSPLSYGPVSDKLLSSRMLRSFIGTKLNPITPDEMKQKIMDKLHKRLDRIFKDAEFVAPKSDEKLDLSRYFIDVFWLDIGQLLYILNRANTVWDAFSPLKHITFSSRDFWTELANADRIGLTKGKWRPVD